MKIEVILTLVWLVTHGLMVRPASATSCGNGTPPSSVAASHATAVFTGTVSAVTTSQAPSATNPDGSVAAGPGLTVVEFEVTHTFTGTVRPGMLLMLPDGVPFEAGTVWLVYATERDGWWMPSSCSRTRPLPNASEDLKYFDGLRDSRPQGLLYGDVVRRIADSNGQVILRALSEPVNVVATGFGSRYVVKTDRWGPFQMVLPPGEFDVSVEHRGKRVSAVTRVRIAPGDEARRLLVADFD